MTGSSITKYATSLFMKNSLRGSVIKNASAWELDSILNQLVNFASGRTLQAEYDTVSLVEMKTLFSSWQKKPSLPFQNLPSARVAFLNVFLNPSKHNRAGTAHGKCADRFDLFRDAHRRKAH